MIYEYDINYINAAFKTKKKVLAHELLKALLYFDIFHFPLTAKEIKRFCGTNTTLEEVESELGFFEKLGYLQRKGEFYSCSKEDINILVDRRIKGSLRAIQMLKKAVKYSTIISYFPFVRGVYLSGSLSKSYADKDSDVDYFIITEPGRLWLSRMMLALFKRLFLFNSHKYFCINYFIDSNSLEIQEKNIFTATELTTLLTTCNTGLYRKLMQSNAWVKDFFPNTIMESISGENIPANKSRIKGFMEKLFSGKLGDSLDTLCYKITLKKWQKKFKTLTKEEFELNLRSKKNVSKHHPRGFQTKILNAYREHIKEFEQKFHINLS